MTNLPKRKIEDRAIDALTDIVNAHSTMDPHINRGDKDMSWDGFIRIFSEGETDSDKKNFDADIPVQIKGHIDKSMKHIGADRITYSVDIDDLNVYFRGNGCLYFQIFVSEDGTNREIFYNSLYPSKIQFYLKFASNKRNKKSYTIPFIRLDANPQALQNLCRQFSIEMLHMGPGRGQIVSRTINANDLTGIRNIKFTTIGAKSEYEALQKISTGDVVAYGTYEENGIEYPIGWGDNFIAAMGQNIPEPIYVGDRKYYDGFRMEHTVTAPGADNYSKDGTDSIILSRNLRFDFNKKGVKFNFEVNTDLMQLGNDAAFLLDMVANRKFLIGEHTMRFAGTDITDDLKNRLEGLKEAGDVLRDIGCKVLIPFRELTCEDKEQIDMLINIKKGVRRFNIDKKVFVYDWIFHGRIFPFIVDYENDQIQLIEYMFSRNLKMSYGSPEEDRGEHPTRLPEDAYIVPNFINMTAEQLANLYYYDYESMYDQVEEAVLNDGTEEALDHLSLMLIGAYDINGDYKLLEMAKVIIDRITEVYHDMVNVRINMLQIEKRMDGKLSTESVATLEELLLSLENKTGNMAGLPVPFCKSLRFSIFVLLGRADDAKYVYRGLSKKAHLSIDGFPIMKLYRDLIDEKIS